MWLSGEVSRRVRDIATRAGLSPEQLLVQLAAHSHLDDDGTLTAGPFPSRWFTGVDAGR
ncbi:hypothetical protein ACIPSE_46595 [Streptomyces sp. NPDC090106]|uniref:hypothetical protein n=1 Tax=Streptomyces sp. NPDC090106 TaxID=3365946 RepID=UPI0037F228C6